MPEPKNSLHIRFMKTRAVSGFCGETSQFAKSKRVARPLGGIQMSEELGDRRLNNLAGVVHPIASRKNPRFARRRGLSDHHLGNSALKETQIRFLFCYVDALGNQFRRRIFEIVTN